jgi:DNA-binding transcriptional regulator YiaG
MRKMDPAELRVAIAALNMTQEDFGAIFHIPARTVRRYLAGDPIPEPTAMLIRIIVARRSWRDLITIGYGG